jgi:hypothetical protein
MSKELVLNIQVQGKKTIVRVNIFPTYLQQLISGNQKSLRIHTLQHKEASKVPFTKASIFEPLSCKKI